MNFPEHHVYFAVFGFGDDPSVVTRIMGVEPTTAWVRGDRRGTSPKGRHTHSRWSLMSRIALSGSIELHLEDVLIQLEPLAAEVKALCERFEAHVAVAAYWAEPKPSFHLNPSVVRRIAQLGLGIDFDLYCLHG